MKNKISIFITIIALILWIFFLFSKESDTLSKFKKVNSREINIIQETNDSENIKIIEVKDETEYSNNLNTNIETQEEYKNNYVEQTETKKEKTIIAPSEYDIPNVTFFSQAPLGIRDQPYQDACEEASLLIGQYYLKNITKTKNEYNKDLLAMVELEMQMLGYFKSTTIMETKQLINKRDPSINTKIIENPSINDLEKEISQNHIIVSPIYGKGLKNPYYALGGPNYHFLVIKGYTKNEFITHDVGTLRGENRHYDKSLIMENIHDRNRTDVRKGAPRVLVMY